MDEISSGYEGIIEGICISGLLSVVPKRVVDNEDYTRNITDKKLKRQIALTGIKRRHICSYGQSASDFATVAADSLLKKIGWDKKEIKVLIFVTQQNDLQRPSTAMLIQKRLDIPSSCTCFDVNMGCSGFTVGLQIIASMLKAIGGKGLLLVGDGRYTETESGDLLFGDGGAAAAIETCEDTSFVFNQFSDGRRFDTIMCRRDGTGQMKGNDVLLFALNEVSENVREFKKKYEIKEGDIDFYVYHQAQKMILTGIASETDVDYERFLNSYEEYGNTSSASIPISICSNLELLKNRNVNNYFMCGFGIGLSWGIVYTSINTNCIFPVEYTDYHFLDKDEL